jgi:hypothetical protein
MNTSEETRTPRTVWVGNSSPFNPQALQDLIKKQSTPLKEKKEVKVNSRLPKRSMAHVPLTTEISTVTLIATASTEELREQACLRRRKNSLSWQRVSAQKDYDAAKSGSEAQVIANHNLRINDRKQKQLGAAVAKHIKKYACVTDPITDEALLITLT